MELQLLQRKMIAYSDSESFSAQSMIFMPNPESYEQSTGPNVGNPQRSGCAGIVIALVGAILSMLYLANLTFGVLEIPDNLPLVGNIDEVVVSGILFACLSRLGINPIPNFRRSTTPSSDRPLR